MRTRRRSTLRDGYALPLSLSSPIALTVPIPLQSPSAAEVPLGEGLSASSSIVTNCFTSPSCAPEVPLGEGPSASSLVVTDRFTSHTVFQRRRSTTRRRPKRAVTRRHQPFCRSCRFYLPLLKYVLKKALHSTTVHNRFTSYNTFCPRHCRSTVPIHSSLDPFFQRPRTQATTWRWPRAHCHPTRCLLFRFSYRLTPRYQSRGCRTVLLTVALHEEMSGRRWRPLHRRPMQCHIRRARISQTDPLSEKARSFGYIRRIHFG